MPRLLLAEDDAGIADPLGARSRARAMRSRSSPTARSAAERGVDGDTTCSCSTSGCPTLDGLEVCRRVRAARPRVPVLMLTARDEELDAVPASTRAPTTT